MSQLSLFGAPVAAATDSAKRKKRTASKDRAPPVQTSLFDYRPAAPARLPASPLQAAKAELAAPVIASGDKAKAHDILAAIRALQAIEQEGRAPDDDERRVLMAFGGFGAVALGIFPDPVKGTYKDAGWQKLGEELQTLLTPEEYASAKRTTFTAFYTAPLVIQAMHDALRRLGVPENSTVLEPGCGSGFFMSAAPPAMHFIGVELDSLSGRIARALYPSHDIRIENFRDTRLPENRIDAVIGNVPFADIHYDYDGQRLSLHDFFLAKSLAALKPGGVMALITSHYTLDKQNAALREYLAESADFLGAVRLPADAFKREGTRVVTDILFLQKRLPGNAANHAGDWLASVPVEIEGATVSINRYFVDYPDMMLGALTRQDRLYGADAGYSVTATGELGAQLAGATRRLPKDIFSADQGLAGHVDMAAASIPLPPLERHVTEGSFFVADDRGIYQVQHGEAMPVLHGERHLQSDVGTIGKRMAALISIRDHARRVLRSQNDGWPEVHRNQARKALNYVYDAFARDYGPINKTTISTTDDGTVTRRMPNLVKFKDDPDAMLVMSLEHYDEETGVATKAAIMHRDVVGRSQEITHVASAEDALLVSLNKHGRVFLDYMAGLYGKPEAEIIRELGDLLYQDPETGQWQPADEYLSGNVRAKLAAAAAAGPAYERNAEALRLVQPEDVLPGDIDANLGAPWLPVQDIEAFTVHLFGAEPRSISIGHLKKDAVWTVEADYRVLESVAVTTDYGTRRVDGVTLLEQALNMKSAAVYDIFREPDGTERRILNPDETLAAREKQKRIKDQFKGWIFSDADRTERLVRLYNDTYNNIRLRSFDGSHLDFPGMNPGIQLRQHQKDAVWRIMSSGNTLLAHVVGAGKSGVMAAAAMKMRQAGLIKKPLIVVPNHLLEQFGREFMQFYPNAKLLMADKENFTERKRKLLTAKIASGDWDGIIVTHSSFELIGLSADFQADFLRREIDEYEGLLIGARGDNNRNIIKNIEKQKAKHEDRLEQLMAGEKKDDGLVFDELGIDHIFYDESQAGKNLSVASKMDRVAGIQTGGSERAFDLYMKTQYLHGLNPGHGLTFATGTPVSNTMVELYTIQRYLDPDGLEARGLGHFDAWAASFGEVVEAMEISPDGSSLRSRSRFARFVNLPELMQIFRAFADVQTADMLGLPTPALKTGKPIIVACPMSDRQCDIQLELVERYERLRDPAMRVDPREDNALLITTDGRKLALDARLVDNTAEDYEFSKVNALVKNVAEVYRRMADTRGAQLVFSDMGVNPTAWGYSVYDDVIDKLVKAGLPRGEIATIGEADTDAKKQVLFEKVRAGQVRVLLGSTSKMGTGTNVQKRLVALHHLDAPWKPAEVEQRDGRILRQGNGNTEVEIYRYVTEGSFDAYMWQALETKARFIAQVMTGSLTVRQAEDIGGQELSYAEVKAIASGNPAVLVLAEADAELKRLAVLQKHHADEQYLARRKLKELPVEIASLERRRDGLAQDMATVAAHTGEPVTIDGRPYGKDDVIEALTARLKRLPALLAANIHVPLGVYSGMEFGLLTAHAGGKPEVYTKGALTRYTRFVSDSTGARAILNAVERLIDEQQPEYGQAERNIAITEGQQRDFAARVGLSFPHDAYLAELTERRNQLEAALSFDPNKHGEAVTPPPTGEIVAAIKTLRAGHAVEDAPERTARTAAQAAESVTTRIRRTREAATEPIEGGNIAAAWAEAAQETTAPLLVIRPEAPERVPRVQARQLGMF